MVVHACNPSTWEAKAGEPQTLGQPVLYKQDPVSEKEKKKREGKGEGSLRTWAE
jgi:hypothetical protein